MKDLHALAQQTQKNAYCPYSGHSVSAAIRTKSGKIYTGCNVENSSFGATACAEQVAIQKAVSEEGRIELAEILVLTDPKGTISQNPWPPCGICRQVISEFCSDPKALPIHLANSQEVKETLTFSDLLPRSFNPQHLKRNS